MLLLGWAKEVIYKARPRTLDDRDVLSAVVHDFIIKSVDHVHRSVLTMLVLIVNSKGD